MTKIINIPPRDRSDIEDEARAWVIRLDGSHADRRELQEFREWLARSPLHQEAFDRTAGAWNRLDDLGRWLNVDAATGRAGAAALLRPALAATAVFLVAAFIAWLAVPMRGAQTVYRGEHATAIGEVRAVALPDGTQVQLNTGTRLAVAMDRHARLVRLGAGEAWFQVAHDPDRPFVVYANRLAVRAIGTAFSVRMDDSRVDLTVTEGRVEIASMQDAVPETADLQFRGFDETSSRVPLDAGQHVVFNGNIELVNRWAPPEIERNLAWRDGMLIFDDDPLEQVVAEINRYAREKIIISDSEIQDLRFGGYFRVGDIDSILATFEEDFDIRVERINDELVYLSRRRETD
jgi:transmembrane sensor